MSDETPAQDRLYLTPQALRLVREVMQGRVVWQRHGRQGLPRFFRDDQPLSDTLDIELRWLRDNGYVEHAALAADEEWAIARTTDFGDEVLARWGADTSRFTDMTAADARTLVG